MEEKEDEMTELVKGDRVRAAARYVKPGDSRRRSLGSGTVVDILPNFPGSAAYVVELDRGDIGRFYADELTPIRRRRRPCLGHPAGPLDPMGVTAYCDGSCR